MKKLSILFVSLLFLLVLVKVQPVSAASLSVTHLGEIDVSNLDLGVSLKTYTYAGGTFELVGMASPSAIISIIVDDITKTATADSLGNWTSLISSLTMGDHQFNLNSDLESLDFTLTVGSSSATGTGGDSTSSTSSSTSTTTTTTTLPTAGSLSMSILSLAVAMFSIGLGVLLKVRKI